MDVYSPSTKKPQCLEYVKNAYIETEGNSLSFF